MYIKMNECMTTLLRTGYIVCLASLGAPHSRMETLPPPPPPPIPRTADTLKRLNETEKLLKQRVETAYIDLELSAKAKDEGNEAFKAQK